MLLAGTILAAAFSASVALHVPQQLFAQNKKGTTTTNTQTKDYRIYSNSTLGIKLEVPSDWLYKEINNTAVTFVTAPNNTNRAVVVVEKENVPNGMSLGAFTLGNVNDLQQNTPSFHLITSNSSTLSGNPAHQIVFTAPSATNHEMRKGMSMLTIKDGIAYIITYRAEPGVASFTTQLPIVSHIIKSFQIIK